MFSCQERPYPAAVPLDSVALQIAATEYLVRTLWALLVLIVTILLARAVRGIAVRALARRRAHASVTSLLGNLVQLVLFIGGALLIVAIYTRDAFGWLLGVFGVLGLVIGLSFQDILKSFLAGMWILVERPFRIGDTITVEPHSGVVQEIFFRTTVLRTADGREVVLPNSSLMTTAVVNLTRYPARSGRLTVTLPAGDAGRDVAARLREALEGSTAISADPGPTVVLRGVSGGRASYELTVWGRDSEAALDAAIAAVQARFPQWEVRGV